MVAWGKLLTLDHRCHSFCVISFARYLGWTIHLFQVAQLCSNRVRLFSCSIMPLSLLVIITAGDLLPSVRAATPLPSFLLLLGVARMWSLVQQINLLRQHNRPYNFVMDCASAALLGGLHCPAIGHVPGGIFCADTAATSLVAKVRTLLGAGPGDLRPLDAMLLNGAGGPVAAWHLCNHDTPQWVSLSGLLTDERLHQQRRLEFYHLRTGSRCFVVYLLLDTFRFALVFEAAPAAVVAVDSD